MGVQIITVILGIGNKYGGGGGGQFITDIIFLNPPSNSNENQRGFNISRP